MVVLLDAARRVGRAPVCVQVAVGPGDAVDSGEAEAARRHARVVRPLLAGIASSSRANLSPKHVSDLSAMYAAHILREERMLIPLAARILDTEELRQIGQEMAMRRGTRFGAGAGARAEA